MALHKTEIPNEFREKCSAIGLKLPKSLKGEVRQKENGEWVGCLAWQHRFLELLPDRVILHRYDSSTVAGRQIAYIY